MGLLILPFLLGALAISIFAIINVITLLKKQEISSKEILWGFSITSILFGLICLSYIIQERAWGLSPAFRIPICMVFIPFGIYLAAKTSRSDKIRYFSTLLIISIGLTGILGIIFNDLFFNLIDYLGVKKHY